MGDSITAVDLALKALLPALASSGNGRTVALTLRQPAPLAALLPFHLHVRWPDALPWLGLHATIAALPFTGLSSELASRPLYRVSDACAARRGARQERYRLKRDLLKDCVPADWETGVDRDRDRFADLVLPGSAFVSVQKVKPSGELAAIPRTSLGRFAKRDAPCARLLVSGGRELTEDAIKVLADADLVVIDLQRLRRQGALLTIIKVLAARPTSLPTLIVAGSPSDLMAAGLEEPPPPERLVLVGPPARFESVEVATVGRDRLTVEKRFEASIATPLGPTTQVERLVAAAKRAWWATRQAIDPDGSGRERRAFDRVLGDVARDDELTAGLFTASRSLVEAAAQDPELRAERTGACIRAILHSRLPSPILVLTRNPTDAHTLRAATAAELKVSPSELESLDVWFRSVRSAPLPIEPSSVVLAGYSGTATIDAALATGARDLFAVFDPIEARVAWHTARRMADYLERSGAAIAAVPLRRVEQSLSSSITGPSASEEMILPELQGSVGSAGRGHVKPTSDDAAVYLADGEVLVVPIGKRFEVLGQNGLASRIRVVTDLQPGDQIVLLDEEAHAGFSEQQMAALDDGVLKKQSESRRAWLTLLRAVAEAKKLTAAVIAREMVGRGHAVTSSTVGSWLADDPDTAHAPRRLDTFLALANVMGMQLPSEMLQQYHHDIRAWRVLHRRAGREVARAIRLAYTGRLAPASLARIERDWGVAVRTLIEAAQVGEVDEVVLPDLGLDERREERALSGQRP